MDAINLNQFDSSDQRPLYRRVEDYIESLIHGGGVKPGEPIPSLSQLTKTLGVNTLTVRRAIRELTFKRVLVTLQGRGTFVAEGAVKRVLWVSGYNIFGGDISPYYTDLLRHAAGECEKHRLKLEPVWLESERPFDMVLNANGGEAAILGYIFSGCLPDHRLLNHVMKRGQPFVNVSATHYGKPRSVSPDFPQADEFALEYLRDCGMTKMSILGMQEVSEDLLKRMRGKKGRIETTNLQEIPATQSAGKARVEEQGYLWGRRLVSENDFVRRGIYVSDDVAARGVTRALLEAGLRTPVEIVVRCSCEGIIPLGIPVTYVVYDISELAHQAVKMLNSQIHGWEAPLQYYCPFRLQRHEELLERAKSQTTRPRVLSSAAA